MGFLEANRISFQEVDITMLEEQRLWMYRNIPRDKQPEKGNPLPPQIFNEDHYCGVRWISVYNVYIGIRLHCTLGDHEVFFAHTGYARK